MYTLILTAIMGFHSRPYNRFVKDYRSEAEEFLRESPDWSDYDYRLTLIWRPGTS